jgi:hypothetical protein
MPIPTPAPPVKKPTQGARVWLHRQMERAKADYKELPRWLRSDQSDPTPTRIEELEALLLQRAQEIERLQAELATLQDRHGTLQGVAVLRKDRAEKAETQLTAQAQAIAQVQADASELRSALGFLLMRCACAESGQDAFDVCKREFREHEAALARVEKTLPAYGSTGWHALVEAARVSRAPQPAGNGMVKCSDCDGLGVVRLNGGRLNGGLWLCDRCHAGLRKVVPRPGPGAGQGADGLRRSRLDLRADGRA